MHSVNAKIRHLSFLSSFTSTSPQPQPDRAIHGLNRDRGMSQARITLRPPPNVEFVEGYPGIPAGRDRPHAEVRGAVEVRLPPQGAKAKWVRVELRKIETLPGGGPSNSYQDLIGPSPVHVWLAEGDWGLLTTSDFPFAIRIPESIPPSIALDKGAGIRYELIAKTCMKGKSGFFFKKKEQILQTVHSIVIDKHELHSTWPVYAQPESRHVVEDLLMLTVQRSHTCYGPGDRVKVLAIFKNDGIPAMALRAFEFLLKETIIYRPGPQSGGKKRSPQCHSTPIGEQKVPVNMTVYQGQEQRSELGCFIPQTHTNTTVVAARHIDISYSIQVKAVLATGKPLLLELPVTVSNWPRNMSIEAVRRIGPAPNLSLVAPNQHLEPIVPATVGATRPSIPSQTSQQPAFNTAPARSGLFPSNQTAREQLPSQAMSATSSSYGDPVTGPRSNFDEFGFTTAAPTSLAAVPRGASPAIAAEYSGMAVRRPPLNTNPSRRLTLANAEMDEIPESPPVAQPYGLVLDDLDHQQDTLAGGSGSTMNDRVSPSRTTGSQRSAWPTAEEEKQRLFNEAREQALRTQASMGNTLSPMPAPAPERVVRQNSVRTPPSMPIPEPAPVATVQKPAGSKKGTPWPTAEEEKMRLYEEAQKAAQRTQVQGLSEENFPSGSVPNGGSPPHKRNYSNDYSSSSHRSVQPTETKSTGAQLYQHAMASISKKPPVQNTSARPVTPPSPPAPKPPSSQRSYPTAEEEKAALRYWEAKRAVDRHQQVNIVSSPGGDGPIAYDDLYPSASSSHAINGNGRRVSEASSREAGPPPPPSSPPPSSMYDSAMSEKERLRRKYEADDAAAAGNPPTPPARASGSRASPLGYDSPPPVSSPRSQPLPPADYSGPRFLTAAEEKARLRAQMEAEDAVAASGAPSGSAGSGSGSGGSSSNIAGPSRLYPSSSPPSRNPSMTLSYTQRHPLAVEDESTPPPPPPPLAPRPPVEYIEKTLEEDIRSQAEQSAIVSTPANTNINSETLLLSPTSALLGGGARGIGGEETRESRVDFGLSFRPFSPLDLGVGFDSPSSSMNKRGPSVPPPPPLPPKVPVSQ